MTKKTKQTKPTQSLVDQNLEWMIKAFFPGIFKPTRSYWVVFCTLNRGFELWRGYGVHSVHKTEHEAVLEMIRESCAHVKGERSYDIRKWIPGQDIDPPLPVDPEQGVSQWNLPGPIKIYECGHYYGWLIWKRGKGKRTWKLFSCHRTKKGAMRTRDHFANDNGRSHYIVRKQVAGETASKVPYSKFPVEGRGYS